MKCECSKLKCAVSIRQASDFEDLVPPQKWKNISLMIFTLDDMLR
jgi:hypothetical protein